ncbi:FG-GAP repeat protein, partial [Salmonella enterica]|uniref:FG-GAP repeat protein n=1 Tax=Salmonella enterica TaxID=28901 RepID=UPI003CF2B17E
MWTQVQKIVPSDRAANDQFGQSVSLDSHRLAVGSFKNNNAGRVYLFRDSANAFRETHKISSKDLALADKFGARVYLR